MSSACSKSSCNSQFILWAVLFFYCFFLCLIVAAQQSGKSVPPPQPPPPSSSAAPQFFDPPRFTISGVTDTTSLGGHGSDAVVRARDSLARETAALGKTTTQSQDKPELLKARERTQALLAQHESADLHHQLADLDEKLGDPLDAVREYQRAAEMDSREPYVFDWGAELLLHHAPEPASDVFTRGNRLFPGSDRMLVGLGAAWLARGSFDQAVAYISEALVLNPDDPTPYLFLGRIQAMEKAPREETIARLKHFETLHPESPEANYYCAAGLWKQQNRSHNSERDAQVELLLKNAIRLNPQYAAAYLQLGVMYAERQDFRRAISEYEEAIHVGSDSGDGDALQEVHYRLAQAYRQVGDLEAAKAEAEIYRRLVETSEQRKERERHQIQQFVYTLRDPMPETR